MASTSDQMQDQSMPNTDELKALSAQLAEVDCDLRDLDALRKSLSAAEARSTAALEEMAAAAQKADETFNTFAATETQILLRRRQSVNLIQGAIQKFSPSGFRFRANYVRAEKAYGEALNTFERARQNLEQVGPFTQEDQQALGHVDTLAQELKVKRAATLDRLQIPLRAQLAELAEKWATKPSGTGFDNGFCASEMLAGDVRRALAGLRGEALIQELESRVPASGAEWCQSELAHALAEYRKLHLAPPPASQTPDWLKPLAFHAVPN